VSPSAALWTTVRMIVQACCSECTYQATCCKAPWNITLYTWICSTNTYNTNWPSVHPSVYFKIYVKVHKDEYSRQYLCLCDYRGNCAGWMTWLLHNSSSGIFKSRQWQPHILSHELSLVDFTMKLGIRILLGAQKFLLEIKTDELGRKVKCLPLYFPRFLKVTFRHIKF